jgi:hypothetical protein
MRNSWALVVGVALFALASACSSSDGAAPDGGNKDAALVDGPTVDGPTVDGPRSDGLTADLPVPADSAISPDINPSKCFELSLDPSIPLAIDGTFDKASPRWQRPHDDPAVCPATALLPQGKALVPLVVYAFCNKDSKPHTFDFEMLAQKGPNGELPLDDPYLILYDGQGIPVDPLKCRAVNDDIPNALTSKDSEITGIEVPAGGAITVVGTTVTFSPQDNTGQGYYILVVTANDP